ncbi:hypothetical protein BI081_gp018 [Mycobacterium phage Tonenili]|uniref:Uncharacterized protein n=1 Tax=Mycobacterium phage Tonenili TaxID=1891703 RepID=A0A1C9EH01_9CAUD|nr:hypothetical protein BI081_gp018 [Mycobacterium phage Tonenili]AON96769.1 hypothetical protein SEA_TONENILI_18 [Mycobacterium phage Tonenili]
MTYVLFLWFGPRAYGAESKYGCWMPTVPRVGDTVVIPRGQPDYRGNTDPEDTQHMEVLRVTWTCDGTPHWHAEVQLR